MHVIKADKNRNKSQGTSTTDREESQGEPYYFTCDSFID